MDDVILAYPSAVLLALSIPLQSCTAAVHVLLMGYLLFLSDRKRSLSIWLMTASFHAEVFLQNGSPKALLELILVMESCIIFEGKFNCLICAFVVCRVLSIEYDLVKLLVYSCVYSGATRYLRAVTKNRFSLVENVTLASTAAQVFSYSLLTVLGRIPLPFSTIDMLEEGMLILVWVYSLLLLFFVITILCARLQVPPLIHLCFCGILASVLIANVPLVYFLKNFFLLKEYRISILCCWAVSVPLASCLIFRFSRDRQNTRMGRMVGRKAFHALCLFLFLPCFSRDPLILVFALISALAIFIFVELIRSSHYPFQKLSETINAALDPLIDERDRRGVVVTHLYLLLGVGYPFVAEYLFSVYNLRTFNPVAAAQGLLTTGVGDSAAALVGKGLGDRAHKLPRSKKTIEGLIAFFASYAASAICLYWLTKHPLTLKRIVAILFTGGLSALFESYTDEVDNFVLPLFSLSTFKSSQTAAKILWTGG